MCFSEGKIEKKVRTGGHNEVKITGKNRCKKADKYESCKFSARARARVCVCVCVCVCKRKKI